MGRSSLRTVTEINIDGQAVDAYHENILIQFKVNCDSLSWIRVTYYDNDDHSSFNLYYPKGGEMVAKHNGEIWNGHIYPVDYEESPFKLGHDYTGVFTIYQNYPESADKPLNTGEGKYDVYLGCGKVQQDSTSNTEIYLDKDITAIKSVVTYDGRIIGGCKLKIGNELCVIESYSKSTGIATVIGGYSSAPTAGTEYKLISNYIECDPFVFYCRSDPTCELTLTRTEEGLKVNGSYGQAEEVAMQSYQFSLLRGTKLLETAERKYTYTFEHTFPFNDMKGGVNKVKCLVTTQDNKSCEFSASYSVNTANIDGTVFTDVRAEQSTPKYIALYFKTSLSGTYSIFREDEDGGCVFIRNVNVNAGNTNVIYDYSAGSRLKYRYHITACIDGTVYGTSTEYRYYSDSRACIMKLYDREDEFGRRCFYTKAAEAFVFDCDVDNGGIETTLSNTAELSNDRTPKYLCGGDRFDTGTFTASLTAFNSRLRTLEDNFMNIQNWVEFISREGLYLFKSGNGDAKIIAITGNPTRTYGTAVSDMGITKITYGWTEAADISNAIIY